MLWLFCLLLSTPTLGWSQSRIDSPNSKVLLDIPIEQLVDIEFVTVFKKPGSIMESPAAVYALNNDDIERSGVTNLPDALRMVPGLQVAQHSANSWAVTARGFSGMSRGLSGQFANKLLVLNDGRSIYTPLFSGVSWEAQDFLLDDTERIEVIRGPGATLWGANAVNGVINILSKDSRKTQGLLVTAGSGTEERAFGHLRYGGRLGPNTFYRLYGKYLKLDDLVNNTGASNSDQSDLVRGGFRLDSDLVYSRVMVQGELYNGQLNRSYNTILSQNGPFPQQFSHEDRMRGGHLLTRLQHSFSNSSDLSVQAYYDRVETDEAVVKGYINTYDIEFSHRFDFGNRQEVIWGGGYRVISDHFDSTFAFSLNPAERTTGLANAFLQDEIRIVPRHVSLIIGSKFENSAYAGFQIQPNARVRWTPSPTHTLWAATSRAVRTPSRGEYDARILLQEITSRPDEGSSFLAFTGNDSFRPETLLAFEFGYRGWLAPEFMLDVATFYNRYNSLRTDNLLPLFHNEPIANSPHSFVALMPGNSMEGRTYGVEVAAEWQVSRLWRLRANYSYLKINLALTDGFDNFAKSIAGQSPQHQMMLNSTLNPASHLRTDVRLRYVGGLASPNLPHYITADARVAFDINRQVELSLVGQNLLASRHAESSEVLFFNQDSPLVSRTTASQIQRGVFSKLAWRF